MVNPLTNPTYCGRPAWTERRHTFCEPTIRKSIFRQMVHGWEDKFDTTSASIVHMSEEHRLQLKNRFHIRRLSTLWVSKGVRHTTVGNSLGTDSRGPKRINSREDKSCTGTSSR